MTHNGGRPERMSQSGAVVRAGARAGRRGSSWCVAGAGGLGVLAHRTGGRGEGGASSRGWRSGVRPRRGSGLGTGAWRRAVRPWRIDPPQYPHGRFRSGCFARPPRPARPVSRGMQQRWRPKRGAQRIRLFHSKTVFLNDWHVIVHCVIVTHSQLLAYQSPPPRCEPRARLAENGTDD